MRPCYLFLVFFAGLVASKARTDRYDDASQTVAAGSSVTLSVAATTATSLNYQSQVNGVPISGATGSALTLGEVQVGYADMVAGAFLFHRYDQTNTQMDSLIDRSYGLVPSALGRKSKSIEHDVEWSMISGNGK